MNERQRIGEILKSHAVWDLWRTMPDGPEKYQAYLCSPEWGKLRSIVAERSDGICERCKSNPATAVHHLTYIRKYAELPEDLLHVCQGCHDFTHGKSKLDPKPRRKIYLGGKVEKNCWRHKIVDGLRGKDWDDGPLPCAVHIDGESFDYAGPFFVSCDHGCYHGPQTHGCLGQNVTEECDGEQIDTGWTHDCIEWLGRNRLIDDHGCRLDADGQSFVVNKCLASIDNADVVMAWIDSADCFGTLCEIGFAMGKYKEVWVAFSDSKLFQEMWFIARIARKSGVFSTPIEAMQQFHEEPSNG